jgi:hypothetical protein
VVVLLLSRPAVPDEVPARILRAGAATANITPPLGEPIVGGFDPFPATNVHDELHVRTLVLDDGSTRLAFAICDNVGIPREVFDAARGLIESETQIPGSHVLMSATHTHSATTARGRNRLKPDAELSGYQQFLVRRIADAVRIASVNLEPAELGWGRAQVPDEVFNRRWFLTDETERRNPFGGVDQVRMNPPRGSTTLVRPAGPVDPEVGFLAVRAADGGRPMAVLANYSLHYVGGVRRGDISADYFALFAEKLAELLDVERQHPAFVGILTNGTSGDVNNIDFRGGGDRYAPYEKMRVVADKVATAVEAALRETVYRNWVPLSAELTELTLRARRPTADQLAFVQRVRDNPEGEQIWHSRERHYAERLMIHQESPDEVSVPLQVLAIGDLGLAAIPFEVFVEAGLELKERTPFAQSFTIELANGSYGYLPTPEQHRLGGYETWLGTNFVEEQASVKIIDRLLESLNRLRTAQNVPAGTQ